MEEIVDETEIHGCWTNSCQDTTHTPDWFVVLAEEIKALIGNRYPAFIWVNCAEWEVLCSSLAFGQHIEKGGFPAVDRESGECQQLCNN